MNDPRRLAPGKYKLQVADYELLAEAGAFGDARTELIEGDVIVMAPQFRPHGMVKMRLYDALRDRLRTSCSPFRPVVELSVEMLPDSMPAPDISLIAEPDGPKAIPLPSVALLIEVADSSLREDLGQKRLLYARMAVPEYWVADVNGRLIHRFWAPADGDYAQTDVVAFGEPISAATLPDLAIDTDDL
jgi:Uma2 family endonuclease